MLIEDLASMLPTKFWFIQQSGFRGEDFQKLINQKQELPVAAMFVNGSRRNQQYLQRTCNICLLLSFGSFGQTVSDENNLKNHPIRNKNRLWWPCLLMDRDEMSNLYRGPSIDYTYQVLVHFSEDLPKMLPTKFWFIWQYSFRGEEF